MPAPRMPDFGHDISHEKLSPVLPFGVILQSVSGLPCQRVGSLTSSLVTHFFIVMVCGCGSIGELIVLVNSHSPGSICCASAQAANRASIDPISVRNMAPPSLVVEMM